MRSHDDSSARRARRGRTLAGLALCCTVLLGGCASNGNASSGWLPRGSQGGPVTTDGAIVTNLWIGTWIAALGVGALVWGLMIWVMVAYRRKGDETGLPPQLRYNVPIEILYTVVPVFMVAVLFFYTQRDDVALMDVSKKPDVVVNVIAKQWSWDFNYVNENVFESGIHTDINGDNRGSIPGVGQTETAQPVLYLPVNKRTQFVFNGRDVVHSFWVPAFLRKLDMLPGKTNQFQVVPTQVGEFQGKCAELCGAYHSQMLFKVKVVSQQEYDSAIAALRQAGQTGQLPNTLNREPVLPADRQLVPTPSGSK